MPRSATLASGFALALVAVAACAHPKVSPATDPNEHALSGLAAQHVAVLPTYRVRVMPGLDWARSVQQAGDVRRTLDADIVAAFDERGLRANWIFPDALEQSYKRNSTYATDPYSLAEEPLRSPSFAADAHLPDPLAAQLRTLVALHDDVRLVLAPVELRFEPVGDGKVGRGVLSLALVDARTTTVVWKGEVASDTASSFGPAITASIGARLAGVVAP